MFCKHLTILILTALALLGCATMSSFSLVTDPTGRYQLEGFSVRPPQGSNWALGKHTKNHIQFAKALFRMYKITEIKRHGFIVAAFLENSGGVKIDTAEDLNMYIDQRLAKIHSEGHPNRLVDYKLTPYTYRGTYCTKYDVVEEESNNPNAEGEVFIINIHGISCKHPFSKDDIVYAFYSEGLLKSQKSIVDEGLKMEAVGFLKDIQFTPIE